MEDLVSAVRGIEAGIWSIWFVLTLILLLKDCNGNSGMRDIKKEIENLISMLRSKLTK